MSRSDTVIETARLTLTPCRPGDGPALRAIFTEPGVRRYLLDGMIVGADWVAAEIASSQAMFERAGCGLWVIRDGEVAIGFVGFRHFFDPPELQLVFGLSERCWGHGFATEAARGVLTYAFGTLGFERVVAATDVPNHNSSEVLTRLGMRLERETPDGEFGGTVFYAVSRVEWQDSVTGEPKTQS